MSRSAGVGSPSSSRLWSEWPARMTASKVSGPWVAVTTSTAVPSGRSASTVRTTLVTGEFTRTGFERRAVRAFTYCCEPPLTVRHWEMPGQLEQAVVVHEPAVGGGGELEEGLGVGRPDRGAEGHEEVVAEALRVAALLDEVGEGHRVVAALGHQAPGPAVEAQDVDQHAGERRLQQVGALGVERVEVGAPVLHAGELAAHREAHLARLAGHVEALEEPDEVRVVAVVEDDEPGVDGVVARGAVGAGDLDVDGVGVAAHPGARLEDGHVVVRVEQVGADEP